MIMHELGVVFYVVKDVKKAAEENQVKKVNAVILEIGEVSGVIHEYLIDCWNWAAAREPLLAGAELRIEEIPAVTYCEDCGQEYETVTYGKTCPFCQSERTYLLQGNEFNIKEIEVVDG
jgi:hydrogenase nickel incorporation protein HypA/HybF